ncbi:MAG: DUF547 domain-containing protein [bacterium]
MPSAAHPEAVPAATLDYSDYAEILANHVNAEGLVYYTNLKAHRHPLDSFIESLSSMEPARYESWKPADQLAFWINAYNALTLKAIIDHYPIQPSLLRSLRFPKNSIRQIPGVWNQLKFKVLGRLMTLDQIEHDVIRKGFDEPRVHMALVCAAKGCPVLRDEPYTGDRLENQLDDQVTKFVRNPSQLHVDRKKKTIHLSKILDWYGSDFEPKFADPAKFPGRSRTESAVLNFLSRYVDGDTRQLLQDNTYRIQYLDYDWSLNEQ